MTFFDEFETDIKLINDYIVQKISARMQKEERLDSFKECVLYSLKTGGKRFRPLLSLFVAKMYNKDIAQVLPFAAAVEMIHTYSLIHDDLPAMDNDDFRRGQPTNHKVFGEGMAILAGDALLTEAFSLIADEYALNPAVGLKLVQLLSECAGMVGMVGGQALDIRATQAHAANVDELLQIHRLKTGKLIYAAVVGAAYASNLPEQEIEKLKIYGKELGFAFQVADDIEDFLEGKKEGSSIPQQMGVAYSDKILVEATSRARTAVEHIPGPNQNLLIRLMDFNRDRVVNLIKNSEISV